MLELSNRNNELSKLYSWSDAKRNSARAIQEYRDRWFQKFVVDKTAKMRKERLNTQGIVINCLFATAAVLLISTSFA